MNNRRHLIHTENSINKFDFSSVEGSGTERLLALYNSLDKNDIDECNEIIRMLFAGIGANFTIRQPFTCKYGLNIYIGNNFYAGANCILSDDDKIEIGDNVLFGTNVKVFTANYPSLNMMGGKKFISPVIIEDNVWIGGSVIILPGVTIGQNAFIIAGSVVTDDIPANTLAMGHPAKAIKVIEG